MSKSRLRRGMDAETKKTKIEELFRGEEGLDDVSDGSSDEDMAYARND